MTLLQYEISRSFDLEHGRLYSIVDVGNGQTMPVTVYVAGVEDPVAELTGLITQARADAAAVRAKMAAAGWDDSKAS